MTFAFRCPDGNCGGGGRLPVMGRRKGAKKTTGHKGVTTFVSCGDGVSRVKRPRSAYAPAAHRHFVSPVVLRLFINAARIIHGQCIHIILYCILVSDEMSEILIMKL